MWPGGGGGGGYCGLKKDKTGQGWRLGFGGSFFSAGRRTKEPGRWAGSWEGRDLGAPEAEPEVQWVRQVTACSGEGPESSARALYGRSEVETQKRGVKGVVTIGQQTEVPRWQVEVGPYRIPAVRTCGKEREVARCWRPRCPPPRAAEKRKRRSRGSCSSIFTSKMGWLSLCGWHWVNCQYQTVHLEGLFNSINLNLYDVSAND